MAAKANALHYARATFYYIGFYLVTILYSGLCLLVAPLLPFRARFRLITSINYFYIFWLRLCCGVKVEVQGREHLPESGAYVVIANHQSEWETLFFQTLVRPQCTVLKRELLKIPFFGWALGLLKPIALDRSKRRGALKQLLQQGKERLADKIPVLIFPQGTRVPVGELGRFNKGGAMLAVAGDVPVVPIVHNAGEFWPGKSFVKYPGTVTVKVGPRIDTNGRTVDEVHDQSIEWMLAEMKAFNHA
ncbi:lysophospholipid acyltransferase family protein [Marinobacterium arenosum]|uniref:lysophospholipid acyltransferase family protein n=1 Tax=Marinobacterium arenosum TaxID=2862496 RepID=UPI001C95A6D9|nr:lysophospholipid acyltransferase family protein [Marinobacterium arenosum]MBY4676831.1 1-acyl-sn-glycerol-3-phosphate acyltransferase [Marinobacterium arenosum]